MTREDALTILQGLRERFDAPYSLEDKAAIRSLYKAVMGVELRVTSCQNCFHDAVILIHKQLKSNNQMAQEKKFWLKNGIVLTSPNFHGGAVYTNANLTDEIAAEYLILFPNMVTRFSRVGELRPKAKAKKAKKAQ